MEPAEELAEVPLGDAAAGEVRWPVGLTPCAPSRVRMYCSLIQLGSKRRFQIRGPLRVLVTIGTPNRLGAIHGVLKPTLEVRKGGDAVEPALVNLMRLYR